MLPLTKFATDEVDNNKLGCKLRIAHRCTRFNGCNSETFMIKIKINFLASIFSSIITVIGLAKCTFGNIRLNTQISIYNFISIEKISKTKKSDTHDTWLVFT
jgi:hypothetical protein